VTLPALPVSLTILNCDSNFLILLPSLPDSLVSLNCSANRLSTLPPLPDNLLNLNCSRNPSIACLPYIHQRTLFSFFITGTNINCLPNRFTIGPSVFEGECGYVSYYALDINLDSLPLCTRTSSCGYSTGINTIDDNGIKMYPNPNRGNFTIEGITDIDAKYSIYYLLGDLIVDHSISTNMEVINLVNTLPGIYILKVNSHSQTQSWKFIIE
jgi:hypothetical protein